jgi:hypothetical protein
VLFNQLLLTVVVHMALLSESSSVTMLRTSEREP